MNSIHSTSMVTIFTSWGKAMAISTHFATPSLSISSILSSVTLLEFQPAVGLQFGGQRTIQAGKVKVAQLYWGNSKQIEALKPPFDYVIAGDVVYLENIVHPLLETMSALAGPDTVIILGYQIRQLEAHELFWSMCPEYFTFVKVPREELHPDCCWPENEVYVLKKKAAVA